MPNGLGVRVKPKVSLADGTDAAVDVTVTGMKATSSLHSVIVVATKAAIATQTNKTAEYQPQAGGLNKAAGTDETNNQLVITWSP